uniref:Uncharacterized protein n=1 Tax=Pinguiococcus pyrenoidosus TaxID=172671 RepID=A0A7R9U5S2_9STRA|mmetsp:Transcript_16052/g.61204  ORF Transcript_16052/g.61204 Transcript_16052/m.61204 type:complete len:349 (+) Transcript_16052:192-1238(+)
MNGLSFLCCGLAGKKRGRGGLRGAESDEEDYDAPRLLEDEPREAPFHFSDDHEAFQLLCGRRARKLRQWKVRSSAHPKGWWYAGDYDYVEILCKTWKPGGGNGNVKFCVMADQGCSNEGVLGVLVDDLDKVARCLPPRALRSIASSTYLWLNASTPNERGACTHYQVKEFALVEDLVEDESPLELGDRLLPTPRKHGVEIWAWNDYAKRFFLKRSDTLLHEFGHVFHDAVATFECQAILDMHRKCSEDDKYKLVDFIDGSRKAPYALKNEKELFASFTVPLFGGYNDYAPFHLEGFQQFDAESLRTMMDVWCLSGDDVDELVAELLESKEHEFAPSNPKWNIYLDCRR